MIDLGPIQLKNIADPIRVYSLDVGAPVDMKPTPAPAPQTSAAPRLSIVVLPFANIGGDPAHEHFVDGVTESLTTDLSRIRGRLRRRPQHRFHLQRQTARREDDRPRFERPVCPRRQRSARRSSHARECAAY